MSHLGVFRFLDGSPSDPVQVPSSSATPSSNGRPLGPDDLDVGGEDSTERPLILDAACGALDMALAPNPARAAAHVALTVPEAGAVTVREFDALGRQVAAVDQTVPAGSTRFELPLDALAPGVYVVRVAGFGQATSRTLTVAR